MTPRWDPRGLDQRVVPAAARALRRALDAGARQRRRAAAGGRRGLRGASAAARRADERAMGTGPLRVLREVPQVGLLVVALVFLSGTAAAVLLAEPDESRPAAGPATSGGLDAVVRLGVPPGSDVELYLAQSQAVLDDVAGRLPDDRLLAVVHLSRYAAPDELLMLLEGADLQRVYLRASKAGPDAEVLALPVSAATAGSVLPALCDATAARKAEDARNFATLAESIEPSTPEEELSKADFEAEAARAAAEAEAYSGACATGFAAVVEAPAAVLAQLAERDGVRGVEAAPAEVALADLDVQPLLPETTGTVPSGRER